MNLYLRLFLIYLQAKRASPITLDDMHNQLNLTVLPNDLDINLHVTNSRYLAYCDFSRFDFFVRSGLLAVMKQRKWMPLVAYHDMNYKSSLKVFQKFTLDMNITHFDEKYFYSTHEFKKGDKLIAQGVSHSVVRGREGVIPPQDVVDAVLERQETWKRSY
ncbi:MAG: thioesterase family protein [Cocleimonas sp.]|nr:thioesterase family protein [Cocleimonas sp.]